METHPEDEAPRGLPDEEPEAPRGLPDEEPDAPTGLPDAQREEPPLGVQEGEEPERGPEGMPGIPTEGEPPAAS